jgi:hypothetical protein
MKAFSILSRAIRSKKQEMLVSLQFLCIVTLILSFILFFVEHEVQPEVYNNGWRSVVWAFAQYIGDPGGFADTLLSHSPEESSHASSASSESLSSLCLPDLSDRRLLM